MTNDMTLSAAATILVAHNSNHIKITHYAITRPERAADLLMERTLDYINDRVTEGDDKGTLHNNCIEMLTNSPGPALMMLLKREVDSRIAWIANHS